MIYPNPSTGLAMIDLKRVYQQIDIRVINISNQVLFEKKYNNISSIPLDFGSGKGIYLVIIRIDAGIETTLTVIVI